MAWMRMMGADSVDYHRATVMDRADDHPGQALDYYASRGETPLAWGGSGASRLGLSGIASHDAYEAIYGPGGASDPTTGTRLVRTTRPGMELVISAHKSVAELGVLSRAEDMHLIMDAERDATLSYLDELTRRAGGRRGRAAVPTPASGLVHAHSRHATSRAGDPCPHDHVLLANVIEMLDERGGFKAPDTTLWREHLHAATMVGRLASARTATELGYAIEADQGPSGRLRHWRIAGIPDPVLEVHSKRRAEIEAEVRASGFDSYRARNVAARTTRAAKCHQAEGALVSRWREELREAGYPLPELEASLERACRGRADKAVSDTDTTRRLVAEALSPKGDLGARKVFARRDVIVALAPHLYGRDPAVLDKVVDRTLADPEAIPLLRVRGAKEPVWSTAVTLATEQAIADLVAEQMERTDAPALPLTEVTKGVRTAEARGGYRLTTAQEEAVAAICSSGRGAEIVLGVAGSGKTTMLSVARSAFEVAGYEVLGAATSGQAARNLGRKAGIGESRTLASLTWRLEHSRFSLSNKSVVALDEVGMSDDPDLVKLLAHVEAAGAKVILLGDHRQLGAVGPGGALDALVKRHGGQVVALRENLRQADPDEARALAALRAGDVEQAVSWYRDNGRIVTASSPEEALDRAVEAWANDALAGKDTALMSWRRANVEELNQRARMQVDKAGILHGPELLAPGGRAYRAGDRVVTLAPGANGALVTSERATVDAVDVEHEALTLLTDDRRRVTVAGEEISAERLAHGYAVTTHRSQGQTAERAHLYVDGGGRELAYVAMSRAKESSHAYLVADHLDQATENLVREWSSQRRMEWATDLGAPADRSAGAEAVERAEPGRFRQAAITHARLRATLEARRAAGSANPSLEIAAVNGRLREIRQLRVDLDHGEGIWAETEAGRAARDLRRAHQELRRATAISEGGGWRQRRSFRREAAMWSEREASALRRWVDHVAPEARTLDARASEGLILIEELKALREGGKDIRGEPDDRRLSSVRALGDLGREVDIGRDRLDGSEYQVLATQDPGPLNDSRRAPEHVRHLHYEIDHDISHGLGR